MISIRVFGLMIAGLVAVGCSEPTAPSLVPDVRAFVTGAAAQAVDTNGHFVFPRAPSSSADSTLDEDQAARMALAYIHDLGANATARDFLERQHGATIDFSRLTAASRVEFAGSPYEWPHPEWPAYFRREIAPAFIVRILDGTTPVVSVAVSALATDIDVQDGHLVAPTESGGEFDHEVTSLSERSWARPVSPESACVAVGVATGARVTELPSLQKPARIYGILFSSWRVTVDREVTVRSIATGNIYTTRELFVGLGVDEAQRFTGNDNLFVAAPIQPQVDSSFPDVPMAVRAGRPIVFDRVSVLR